MNDDKKLKPLAELVLVSEIVTQSKVAENSAARLGDGSDPIETWGSIQSILVAAGNVSKILWPASKSCKHRGEQLRNLIGVADDNLLSDRTLRNHFEHYDERVEEWFDSNDSVVYLDSRIDPFEPQPWEFPQAFHRSYNPVSRVLSFRDDSIDLNDLLAALSDIREKCRGFALS